MLNVDQVRDLAQLYVNNNALTAFQNNRMNNIIIGILDNMDNLVYGGGGEPTITAATVNHYYRGDKTMQILNAAAVGLANVPNINATNASNLQSGSIPSGRFGSNTINVTALLASGTPDATTILYGDGRWATPSIPTDAVPIDLSTLAVQSGGVYAALALKSNIASPTFTGVPAAPTAAPGTNTTQLATTAFVTAAVSAATTGVSSFAGRTGAVVALANDYTFAQIDKTTSSIADLTTRSAGDLNSGTLADARLSGNVVLSTGSYANPAWITALAWSKITGGPSVSGSNTGDVTFSGENYISLTGQTMTANAVNLSGTNVTGTLAAARMGALTGDVTSSAGSYATTISGLNAAKIADGSVSNQEFQYINSLTANAQTQLNTKWDTLGAVGSSPNANAASFSGTTLTLQPASASFPGVVNTTTQTFAGDKTIVGTANALTISSSNYPIILTNTSTAAGVRQGALFQRVASYTGAIGDGLALYFSGNDNAGISSQWGGISYDVENAASGGMMQTAFVVNLSTGLGGGSSVADRMRLSGNGKLRLHQYGDGTFTGTLSYVAGWDANGNFIEVDPVSLGGGGGSGTVNTGAANRLAYYTGAGTTVDDLAAITASRALVSDTNGLPTHSATTATQLGYLSTTTSDVQTQINSKEASLGNPSTNGYVLSSTTAGVRSWVLAAATTNASLLTSGYLDAARFAGTPTDGYIATAVGGAIVWQPNAGGGGTVDSTIIDGSTNAVSGNAVFDALAAKQNALSGLTSGEIVYATSGSAITTNTKFKFDATNSIQTLGAPSATESTSVRLNNEGTSVNLISKQYGSTATGSTLGASNANLSSILSTGASGLLIGTTDTASITIRNSTHKSIGIVGNVITFNNEYNMPTVKATVTGHVLGATDTLGNVDWIAPPEGAKSYYVSPTGIGTGEGSTQGTAIHMPRLVTLSASFVGNERIFFQSGGTYVGKLPIKSHTYIGRYGDGAAPVVSGAVASNTLTWTQNGTIWSAPSAARVARLLRNGLVEKTAQSAFYTVTGTTGTVITASGATGLSNVTAMEMISKEFDFRWTYNSISAYNSGTGAFTIDRTNYIQTGFKFRLFNHPDLISADGDWAWVAGTVYYKSPGNVNPNTLNVDLSVHDEGLLIEDGSQNIIIDGVDFYGQAMDGVYGKNISNINISNCSFRKQLCHGVVLPGNIKSLIADNNTFEGIGYSAIGAYTVTDFKICRQRISNIGTQVDPPFTRGLTPRYSNLWACNSGITVSTQSSKGLIEDCTVDNVAYLGIRADGNDIIIRRNRVYNHMTRANDGGGIYTNGNIGGGDSMAYNIEVSNNIVWEATGSFEGAPTGTYLAAGIYLDNYTTLTRLLSNTCYDNTSGIYLGYTTKDNEADGNILYNNSRAQISILNHDSFDVDAYATSGTKLSNNTFVSLASTQYAIEVYDAQSAGANPFSTGGYAKNNTFISPYNSTPIWYVQGTPATYDVEDGGAWYSQPMGQMDSYTASYVNESTAKANIPLELNLSTGLKNAVVPANFHNPMDKYFDPVIAPYNGAVFITGAPTGGGGGSNWTLTGTDLVPTTATQIGIGGTPAHLLHLYASDTNAIAVVEKTGSHTSGTTYGFQAKSALGLTNMGVDTYFDATGVGLISSTMPGGLIFSGNNSNNHLRIPSNGSIRFNDAYSFPTSMGSAGQVLAVPSFGTTLEWATAGGGSSNWTVSGTDIYRASKVSIGAATAPTHLLHIFASDTNPLAVVEKTGTHTIGNSYGFQAKSASGVFSFGVDSYFNSSGAGFISTTAPGGIIFSGDNSSQDLNIFANGTIRMGAYAGNGAGFLAIDNNGDLTWSAGSGGGGGMTNPMTTTGDLIYSSSGSTPSRLPAGVLGEVLRGGTTPSWGKLQRVVTIVANSDHTITSSEDHIVFYSTTTTQRTITLPAASSNNGREITIYIVSHGGATQHNYASAGGDIIHGATNLGTSAPMTIAGITRAFVSNGTNWIVSWQAVNS